MRNSFARLAAAVVIGAAIGTLTSFGQAHLNLPWSALVNSASPWLLGGFAAGALQVSRSRAIAAGLVACVLEVVAYYVVTDVRGYAFSDSEIAFWAICALAGGPLFGWSGWAWWSGGPRVRPWSTLLPATWIAEGVGSYQLRLGYHSAALLFVVIGLILAIVLPVTSPVPGPLISRASRRQTVVTAGIAVAATLAGILLYWQALDLVSPFG